MIAGGTSCPAVIHPLPLPQLTALYVLRLGIGAEYYATQLRLLRYCEKFGFLRRRGNSFVAFFYGDQTLLQLILDKDFPGTIKRGRRRLSTGPVLYIVGAMSEEPRWLMRTVRALCRPGVAFVVGERLNRGFRYHRLRQRKEQHDRAAA